MVSNEGQVVHQVFTPKVQQNVLVCEEPMQKAITACMKTNKL